MAVTRGQGNPSWGRDEVILALELYFQCGGLVPAKTDTRVVALSELLRSLPHHRLASRQPSFRNADGVVFKLQNLRQIATGKGLSNVSRVDVGVWTDLGNDPTHTTELCSTIRLGIEICAMEELDLSDAIEMEFAEGRIVTEAHFRRERNRRIRTLLLEQRSAFGHLRCEICDLDSTMYPPPLVTSLFEAHHVVPLSGGAARKTRVSDMALLCANCHRMLHRAIAIRKRWLTIAEGKRELLVGGQP